MQHEIYPVPISMAYIIRRLHLAMKIQLKKDDRFCLPAFGVCIQYFGLTYELSLLTWRAIRVYAVKGTPLEDPPCLNENTFQCSILANIHTNADMKNNNDSPPVTSARDLSAFRLVFKDKCARNWNHDERKWGNCRLQLIWTHSDNENIFSFWLDHLRNVLHIEHRQQQPLPCHEYRCLYTEWLFLILTEDTYLKDRTWWGGKR